MVIGFIFAWMPGVIYTAFKVKYAVELKDLQWGDGKWEFWIRKTHNILGFLYGFSLYRKVFNSSITKSLLRNVFFNFCWRILYFGPKLGNLTTILRG